MRDVIEARLWADHGHQFSKDLHRLFVGLRAGLAKLHELNWDAPWRTARSAARPSRLR